MATAEKQKRSEEPSVWDHFIKNPLDGSKPTCRKCRQVVSRGRSTSKAKSWGNGPLWTHLKQCRPSSSPTTQLSLQQTFTRSTPLQKDGAKAQAITHAIGMMVAVDLRPYSIVENEGFRELLKILEPRYSIISRKELTNNVIPELFSDLKEKIKKSLESSESRVNFTTDMWKWEGQNREYMMVTAHWAVENGEQKRFEMKNALLEVEEFTDSAHAYNIRKSVSILSRLKFIYNNLKYHMF